MQGTETEKGKCDEQKCRQKVLHAFFVKKKVMIFNIVPVHIWPRIMKESTFKFNRSEQKPSTSSQPGEQVWSVKDSTKKAEIIATLQFAAQN